MVQPVSRVGILGDATQALRLQATLTPAYYKEQPLWGWDVEGLIYTGLFDALHLKDLPIIQFNPLRG